MFMEVDPDSAEQQIKTQELFQSEGVIKQCQQLLQFRHTKNLPDKRIGPRQIKTQRTKKSKKEKKQKSGKKRGKENKKINTKNDLKKYFTNRYAKFMMSGILMVLLLHTVIYLLIGQDQKFDIEINMGPQLKINNIGIGDLGLIENPQVGTHLDIFNITQKTQFHRFQKQYSHKFKSKIEVFYGKLKIKQPKQLKHISQNQYSQIFPAFKNQIKTYAKNYPQIIGIGINKQKQQQNSIDQLIQNLSKPQLQAIQQKYIDLKYNISNQPKKLQFCILVYSFLINQHLNNFNTNVNAVISQNYQNYNVIIIDDASPNHVSSYLDKDIRKNKKVSVVRNKIEIGKDSSFFIHSKLCRPEQIILYLDSTFQLVGYQNLNILNTLFQNQDLWVVYPSFIKQTNNTEFQKKQSKVSKSQNYDRFTLQIQDLSEVIAHRGQLLLKFPSEHFFEYAKAQENKPYYTPVFHYSKKMKFLTYCLLQLSGQLHTHFSDHVMYAQENQPPTNQKCQVELSLLNEQKALIKTPLNRLYKLSDFPSYKTSQKLPQQLTKKLSHLYLHYKKCSEDKRKIENKI